MALTAHRNVELLARQCIATGARYAVIGDAGRTGELRGLLEAGGAATRVLSGPAALEESAALEGADTVMAAIVGAAGLRPTLRAMELGRKVLLANKESMVIAGPLFNRAQQASGAVIIPVDSEHNALFQALPPDRPDGLAAAGVRQLILTASGGPFLHADRETLARVTPREACAHPNWVMGRKISVDSATLMNKGLEVIEARWLFQARPDQMRVVIHPQSIVHSMVSYRDGSVLAQLGMPDMRTPIAHALAWPERIDAGVQELDMASAGPLEFFDPDLQRFPCLQLAFEALAAGGDAAVILNAANEIAVQAFLDQEIAFMQIPELVEHALQRMSSRQPGSLEEVLACDQEARTVTREGITGRVAAHG